MVIYAEAVRRRDKICRAFANELVVSVLWYARVREFVHV